MRVGPDGDRLGGSRVDRWDDGGRLTASLLVPASQPACPALGGPDGRDLLVATAATGLSEPGAPEGRLYVGQVEVAGAGALVAAPV